MTGEAQDSIVPKADTAARVTRIAIIERNGEIIKRAFTSDDLETSQLSAIFWLEETWRPDDRFIAICYPEFDIWPGRFVSEEELVLRGMGITEETGEQ